MKFISIENKIFIREEINGISIYDSLKDAYFFYKNLDIKSFENIFTLDDLNLFLENNKRYKSLDIDYSFPIKVNWLISDECNLDCIYCFAANKLKELPHNPQDINQLLKNIDNLYPLTVGISGGEPMLSPILLPSIKKLSKNHFIILDINGAIELTEEYLDVFKKANILVRISIDTFVEDKNKIIRSSKSKENYLPIILKNINFLKDYNIPICIHTVVTQLNKDTLLEMGKTLVELNIKRWHLYGVYKNEKCEDIFSSLEVSQKEFNEIIDDLSKEFKDNIFITGIAKLNNGSNTVVLIDKAGAFFVEDTDDGINYICKSEEDIDLEKLKKYLNTKGHCQGYLNPFY